MNVKIKVLFILPEILGPGGQELETIGFARTLQTDQRFEVEVLNFINLMGFEEFEKLPKVRWQWNELKSVFLSKEFLKIFLKSGFKLEQSIANCFRNFPYLFDSWFKGVVREFDICFAGISPTSLLPHILEVCNNKQVPFAYHETSIFHPKNHNFYKQLESDGYFLISAKEKEDYLLANYPKANYGKIKQWIYLGQTEFLLTSNSSSPQVRFGSLGRVDQGKNFLKIIEALNLLQAKGFQATFTLFGDGPELNNLQAFVKKSNLENMVFFKGGFPFDQRVSCFKELDVFVLTSTFEGGPLVVLEAMAAAKPVISTRVGDVPNRVFEDVNGYVLSLECSAEEVANKMEIYCSNQNLLVKHGKNSREIYLKDFESSKCEELFKNNLLSIIGSKKNSLSP